jgi:hypothetical protein
MNEITFGLGSAAVTNRDGHRLCHRLRGDIAGAMFSLCEQNPSKNSGPLDPRTTTVTETAYDREGMFI